MSLIDLCNAESCLSNSTVPTNSTSIDFTNPLFVISSKENIDKLDDQLPNIRIIWTTGFIVLQFHLLGTLYVMRRTWLRWKRTGKLSMACRLPFYFSCLDLIIYILYNFNGIPTMIQGHVLESTECNILAGLTFYTISTNMSLAGNVAICAYLRVCCNIKINWGKYDERLFITSMIPPAVMTPIVMPSFGSDIYWCYCNRQNHVIIYVDILFHFCVLVISCFCYFKLIHIVTSSKNQLSTTQLSAFGEKASDRNEVKVIKKVFSYITIFVLNWAPNGPYLIGQIMGWAPFSMYLLAIVTCSSGGVLNCLQYMINEGIWEKDEEGIWKEDEGI